MHRLRNAFSVNALSVLPTGRSQQRSQADRSGLTAGEGRALTSPNGTPRAVVCLDGGDPAHRPELEANGLGPGVAHVLPAGVATPTDACRPGLADGRSADAYRQLPFEARSDGKRDRAPAAQGTPSLCAAGPYLRDGLLFPDARPGVTQ